MEINRSFIDWALRASILLGIIGIALVTNFETIFLGFLFLFLAFAFLVSAFVFAFFQERSFSKERISNPEEENIEIIVSIIKSTPFILGLYFLISEVYFLFNTDFSKISVNETIPVLLLGLRITMIFVWPLIYAKDLVIALFNGDFTDIKNLDIFQTDLFHKTINLIITVLVIIRGIEIIFK